MRDDNAEELVSGPKLHLSSSQDAIYSQQRPKRIPAPSQKAILNDKWKESHTWAQRVIAYSKSNKTLEFKRLYYRLTTLSYEDPRYHNFDSKFDFSAIVRHILAFKKANSNINDYKSLTYKEAITDLYAR